MRRVIIGVEQLRQRIPGGIGTYTRGLLTGLAALRDPDFSFVRFASKGSRPDSLAEGDFPLVTSSLSHRLQIRAWTWGLGSFPDDGDIAHLCSFAAPMGSKMPSTAMVHDVSWRRFPELTTARGRRWHERQLKRLLESSATLLVPSTRVRDDLTDGGVSAHRITVIGEGADHLPAPDRDAARTLLAQHGISAAFIICVATLEPRKNLVRLIEAHAMAQAQGLATPLVIVGPRGWGADLARENTVVIEGHVSPDVLAGLYAEAALLAYVPVEEGFGLPPLEALWLGTPVLASTATPSVEGSKSVIVVDPLDIDAIARGLSDGIEQAAELAAGAHQAVQARTWRRVAEHHTAIWRSF